MTQLSNSQIISDSYLQVLTRVLGDRVPPMKTLKGQQNNLNSKYQRTDYNPKHSKNAHEFTLI